MAPRAHWKGFLKLSLVSCPIALYPAIAAAEKISFRQVNRETGNRLRQQLVDAVTGEVVGSHNKGRGYEVGENDFLLVENEDLEAAQQEARERPFSAAPAPVPSSQPSREVQPSASPLREPPPKSRPPLRIAEPEREEAPPIVPPPAPPRPIIENTRTIELHRFVDPQEIDPAYFNTPYFIVPRDAVGQEAFAVIRDAMAAKGVVGIGRVVLSNRERPILIEPMGSGLRGMTLRYAHEVRDATEYFAEIPKLTLPDEMLAITEHILDTKTEGFDSAYLEDRYRTVLVEKIRERQAQKPARTVASPAPRENVVHLMEMLKRSLAVERPTRATSRQATTSRKRPAGKRQPARARKAS
jgi:non-homologous end joining protein Ku